VSGYFGLVSVSWISAAIRARGSNTLRVPWANAVSWWAWTPVPCLSNCPRHVHLYRPMSLSCSPPTYSMLPHLRRGAQRSGPATTGIRSADSARSALLFERALALAGELLVPGGHFLGKIFQGTDFDSMVRDMKRMFAASGNETARHPERE